MKIFISIILSAVLLLAMSACESSSEEAAKQSQSQPETSSKKDSGSKSDESSTSNTAKNTINGSNSAHSSGSTDSAKTNSSNEKEEVFYGQWQINKVIAYGPAGTYSSDDVKNLIGKQLTFSKDSATSFGDKIEDMDESVSEPIYKKTEVAKNEFTSNYRVTFEQLGIDGDTVTEVDATSTQGIGTVIFITDKNKLILFGGGTFFELAKSDEPAQNQLTSDEINQNEAVSLVEDYLSNKNELVQDENHFVQFEEMYHDYYMVRYSTLVSGHSSTNGRYAVDIKNGNVIEITDAADLDELK
ncbi:hypothetical protein WMO40_13745 [Bacillaceae bacterium CLA-AA-H227]|uniref:Uncharacterized protein n=1 Tax=Robertmurraya yapensis (ex Hitch et al 2024) TaxID=3133160 RepID=A0ACC6SD14_9BACI